MGLTSLASPSVWEYAITSIRFAEDTKNSIVRCFVATGPGCLKSYDNRAVSRPNERPTGPSLCSVLSNRRRIVLSQVLTVSVTRENEVQQLVVTFTGNTTDGGTKMFADATTNAFVSLTFDSGSMNWACTDASVTTSDVRPPLLN